LGESGYPLFTRPFYFLTKVNVGNVYDAVVEKVLRRKTDRHGTAQRLPRSFKIEHERTMPVLSPAELQQFQQQGFLLIPQVYAKGDLLAARALFQKVFSEKNLHCGRFDSSTLLTDIYRHFPGLERCVFNERYRAVARELLGPEAVLIPECAVHRNRFIHWHKDTTVQEMAGVKSHSARDAPPILQFATYFQDNSNQGGGLTVIPGTHRLPDPFLGLYSSHPLKRLWNKLLKIMHLSVFDALEQHPDKTDIPLQLGDLLVFDVRIFHRATFRGPAGAPEKFAIFNTCIHPKGAGLEYFRFMKQRPEPYYRYFREEPLPPALWQRAKALGIDILY